MTDPAWIKSMQEELLQFKRMDALKRNLVIYILHLWLYFGGYGDIITVLPSVSKYVLEILKKYGMESCDPVGTPMEIKDKLDLDQNGTLVDATKYRSMIGALMYLTSSRPDIDSGFELTGFSDADYAGCKDSFKSTSGGAQFLGEKLVSWSSKKQDCTALSTAEAEYVSLSVCCAQVLWMRTQLTDYGFHFAKIPIYCDSKSAIAISCNPVQHSKTKHIAVRYHFIKEHVEKGTIELYFVKTDYQLADIFTKALPTDRFNYLVRRLGTIDPILFSRRFDNDILVKYGLNTCDIIGTPMDIKDKLDLDQIGTPVDATKYRSMIGALMYLMSSRPNIIHATCVCARYQAHPTEKHLKEVKRIFCYLRGTVNMGLWYTKDSSSELTGFSDADYAGCKDTFKSTSGGAQFLGEKLVSWSLKKQDCTLLSTAKSEYVSLSACCAQVLWMRTQLIDYGYHIDKIPIYCDSKSAIAISCNPVQHSKTKDIAVQYHFIKEHVEKGTIELYFVKTDYQLADIFTKALPVDRFNYLVRRLGMRSLCPLEFERLAKLKWYQEPRSTCMVKTKSSYKASGALVTALQQHRQLPQSKKTTSTLNNTEDQPSGKDELAAKAQIHRIFLDGYGVLDVGTVIFKCLRLSSRMRTFMLIFTK
nr:copia protein [Tanacetum cinerariifolium]